MFVSYSHKDVAFVTALTGFIQNGLMNLAKRLGVAKVELWTDAQLRISQTWQDKLDYQMSACVMGLVVASPASIRQASYVVSHEIPGLAGRRAGIPKRPWSWVLYRDCEQFPDLAAQNAVIHPDRPLVSYRGSNREKRYTLIVDRLVHELETCIQEDSRYPTWKRLAEQESADAQLLSSRDTTGRSPTDEPTLDLSNRPDSEMSPGDLFGVPPLPPVRIERPDLVERVTNALMSNSSTSIISNIGVSGMGLAAGGGFGKSVLASLVAHSEPVRRMFPDGIVWVTLGRSPDMYEVLCRALSALGHEGQPTDLTEAQILYKELIPSRRALVIVDDVWQVADARPFTVPDGLSRLLMTSRDAEVLQELGCEQIDVKTLSAKDGWELLWRAAGWQYRNGKVRLPVGVSSAVARSWVAKLGRVPLPLTVLGSALKGANSDQVNATFDRLKDARANFGDHRYADLFAVVRVKLASLTEAERQRFGQLVVFTEDKAIPTDVTSWFWGTDGDETARTLERLAGLLTLRREGDVLTGWSVHGHVRDFLLYDVDDLEAEHETFVANLEPLCGDGGWADLACRSKYLRENLLSHMVSAGRGLDAVHLATEPHWVISRVIYDGVYAARADIDRVSAELTIQQRTRTAEERDGWSRLLRSCAEFFRSEAQPAPTTAFADLADQWDASVVAAQIVAYAHNAGLVTDLGGLGLRWWWHRDGTSPLSTPSSSQLAVLLGHNSEVLSVWISGDGSRVVSAGADGAVRVWDGASGNQVGEMLAHAGEALSAGFSADGSRVVFGGDDGSVRVWDAVSGEHVGEMVGHTGSVLSVGISADSSRVMSGGDGGAVRVWDVVSGEQVGELVCQPDEVWSVGISADGSRVVSGEDGGAVRVWDAVSGEQVGEMLGHTHDVGSVGFSSDGFRVVSGGDDGAVLVWDAVSGEQVGEMVGHTDHVWSVGFSPDGSRVVSGGRDGLVRVWDAVSGAQVGDKVGHTGGVLSAQLSADGSRVVSAGADGSVRVWDAVGGGQVGEMLGHTHDVGSVGFSSDGSRVVSGGDDGAWRVWDAVSGELVGEMVGHTGSVASVGASADGSRAMSCYPGGSVRVWDSVSGELVGEMDLQTDGVESVGLSADGSRAVFGGDDGLVRVWDVVSGEQVVEMIGHTRDVGSVGFSADGSRVVSGGLDGSVRVWDVVSGELVGEVAAHADWVCSVGLSGDGSRAVSGGFDASVRVWDVVSGALVGGIDVHTGSVLSVGFSPDGSRVVSGGFDGSVRVCEIAERSTAAVARLHGTVRSVAIDPLLDGPTANPLRLAVGYGKHVSVIRVCWRDDEAGPRSLSPGSEARHVVPSDEVA